jgi:hypothetical protein
MARSLRVHVQVDRLPDVDDGKFVQLGLRVSAAIVPEVVAGDPPVLVEAAKKGDEKFILPWLWRKADDTAWDPHVPASWKVYHFRVADQKLLPIAAGDLIFLTADEAGVPLFDPPDGTGVGIFRQRIDEEVADVVKAFGPRQAFEVPTQGVISGRTVYGLAESLTSLPNPVPAAMKVWTAARVEKTKLDSFDKEDLFLAVPVFAAAGAAYEPQDPVLASDQWTASMTRTGGDPVEAAALIHPSLPASRLEIGDNPQRLIDLSRLTIRAKKGEEFESADWIASVGTRIAEAIDPAARAMAVLDTTIGEVVHEEALKNLTTTQTALVKDMAQGKDSKDLFRKALDELHRPIVTPRARRSEAATAPAASFLEALALRTPQLWPTVVPLLFAQAGAEDKVSTPDASFAATSCARLLGAAGVPPSPSLKTVDAEEVTGGAAPRRIPTLDTEIEFVDWLARHWTTCPRLAESTGDRSFEGTLRVLTRKPASPVGEAFEPVGVVDFARVSQDTVIPIQLSKIEGQEFPCTVTVVCERPQDKQSDSSVKIELTFEADKTTIKVDGVAQGGDPHQLTEAQLALKVTAEAPPKLSISYTPKGADPIPLTLDASKQELRGRMGLWINTTKKIKLGIDPASATMPSVDRERLVPQAQAFRAALAWAYAGSVVPGLLQGWVPIPGQTVSETGKEPLAIRLPAAMDKFIQTLFRSVFNELAKKISDDENDPLRKLFEALRDAAIRDAQRLAHAIVPPALGDSDRVTEDALPLAFLVSQLQDFDEKDDLWGRLAGAGVLISRDDQLTANEWWSLNAASLHVAIPGKNGREPLTKATAVLTAKPVGGDDTEPWKKASKVDPVPLSVGDVGGVRSALIKYENHSIVGEVEGAPQVDPAGQGAGCRRPEAFLFPPTHFTRIPALTFGRTYGILPYLIGHGGALPVPLRQDPANPVKLKELDADDKLKITMDLGSPGTDYVHARTTRYMRTVPVGAPRLAGAQWPGTFPGVQPLVDELPLRPAPLTLKENAEARFFLDQRRLTGLLSSREAAIRIEIGEIAHAGANASLLFRADRRDSAGTISNALSVEVEVAKLRAHVDSNDSFGLRIEAGQTEGPKLWVLRRREHEHADDEPEAIPLTKGVDFTANLALPVEQWDSTYLVVAAQGGSFDFEPPTIRWASKSTDGTTLVLAGDRPILPPELAHAARKVAVLDGIRVGGKTGPSSVTLNLRRPSTSVSTYERWINGPTGKYGAGALDTIRKKINEARVRAADLGRGDCSFDDPAVEALFVEVVQLFPRRVPRKITTATTTEAVVPVMIAKLTPESLGERLRFDNPQFATLNVKVTSNATLRPTSEEDLRVVGGKNTLDLELVPGCAYEIRLYGAVPEKQVDFAPVTTTTADRFSPAVRATWRDVKDAASAIWHLGTPLTLTVEVATEIMPECWPRKGNDIDFDRPAFALDFARPPAAVEDRALVRLVPEHLGPPILQGEPVTALRYPALRYVNRAALIHQRWSWRGRPHPQLIVDASPQFGTKGKPISDELGKFVDVAFLGRSDDDIGAVREVAFGRAHAVGGQAVVTDSTTKGKRPVLLEHDLDRRVGTHLWRFALRLKSRYAAMRPNHPDLLRFSHLQKNSSLTHWWRVVVPDRAHPGRALRGIDRPSLMLVLPLTEPRMTEGSVPPLLAVFNQEMFPQFNAADGMETVIDVARHPFPGRQRIDKDKKPETGTKTYGELLREKWDDVAERARKAFDKADVEYSASLALKSDAVTAQQTTLAGKKKDAFDALQAAEAEFKAVQEKGAAWGVVKQWDTVKEQVEEALKNATTEEEKQRLQKRLDVDIPAEKAKAEIFAKGLEAGSITLPIVAGTPANPFTKYFQEFSPDTLREATPALDRPVAIRMDGPVGYTFDAGVEAGRFDHAAMLVSPVAEIVRPGSFMRLRFRRMETPGLLVAAAKPDPTWPDELPAVLDPPLTKLPVEGARFLVSRSVLGASPVADKEVHRFETAHEGLAFEIADLAKAGPVELRFKLVPPVGDAPCVEAEHPQATTVFAKIDNDNKVVLSAQTHLGPSAEWSLPLSAGATAQLQILVSLRPKPNTGPDANVQEYTPVGDVSVRIRIEPDDGDHVQRAQERAWLSVLCMPLTTATTTTRKFTDLVAVRVCPKGEMQGIEVKPLRLSDFAPAVWCQFAAVMSRFKVRAETSLRSIVDVLPVSALNVTLAPDAKTFRMGLIGLRTGETLTKLTLLTEGDPTEASEARAQVEEPIYAVVTRFVYDAFDRLRERAIGIHPLDGSALSFGPRIWPPGKEEDRESYTNEMHGRVRFLRVLRGKLREQGGFETSLQEFPKNFFGTETDEALDAEPSDAAGMVMGISAPIEWGSD